MSRSIMSRSTMSRSSLLAAMLAAGAILAMAPLAAHAASAMTDAFVVGTRSTVATLEVTSRLAADQTSNSRVRAFARSQAEQQAKIGASLLAWEQIQLRSGNEAPLGSIGGAPGGSAGVLGPLASIASLPITVANGVTNGFGDGAGDLLGGRPLAVGGPTRPTDPTPLGSALLPSDQILLRLRATRGADFDALYLAVQRGSLIRLATLFRDYIKNGDDPALRAISVRDLPIINRKLSELGRL